MHPAGSLDIIKNWNKMYYHQQEKVHTSNNFLFAITRKKVLRARLIFFNNIEILSGYVMLVDLALFLVCWDVMVCRVVESCEFWMELKVVALLLKTKTRLINAKIQCQCFCRDSIITSTISLVNTYYTQLMSYLYLLPIPTPPPVLCIVHCF